MDTWQIKNGDLAISGKGRVVNVGGAHKVVQDLTHWLLNDLGYNKFHPWMGASLDDFVGQPTHPGTSQALKARVRESLNRYAESQVEDLRERIDERGNSFMAIGLANPSSIVRDWTSLEVLDRYGDLLVRVGFKTFTNQEEVVSLIVKQFDTGGLE